MSSPRELVLPSTGSVIFDDFIGNDIVTDNNIGQFGWQFTTIVGASTLAFQTSKQHGVLRITTAAGADGEGTALHSFPDGLLLKPGIEFGARVGYPVELASMNFRVGLDNSVTATRPTVGITIESDAGVLTCNNDSATEGDESLAVTGHPDLTSGTTMIVAADVDFKFVCSGRANAAGGPAEVDYFVNDVHVAKLPCHADDDEPVEMKFAIWQDSGGADAVAIEIDYYQLFIPR